MVKVDLTGTSAFFDPAELDFAAAAAAHRMLGDKSGAGSEFTGWLELPERIRDGELKAILSAAQRIRSRSKALVVIGIGGSYLGARGAIELLRPIPSENDPKIFFIGNGLSPDALNDTLAQLGDMDFDINVISKSGTTLEPALAFRIFRKLAREKYGSAAKNTYSLPRTRTAARSSPSRMPRAGSASSFPTMSADDTAFCRQSVCCRWRLPALT